MSAADGVRGATGPPASTAMLTPREHLASLSEALASFQQCLPVAERWGARLAALLPQGQRLLAAGNGGSAAEAQHLTAELVGRFRLDRPAFSAIALHADTSSLTALANDYGADEIFARQVEAHGRAGDVLVLLSTSGRSPNLLRAAARARSRGLLTWAFTGALPNPLAAAVDEALPVPSDYPGTVQELHLVGVHLVCAAFDTALGLATSAELDAPAAALPRKQRRPGQPPAAVPPSLPGVTHRRLPAGAGTP